MNNIQIIQIGHNEHVNFKNLKKKFNNSSTFKSYPDVIISNPAFLSKDDLRIFDTELSEIITPNNVDFSIGIINRPLEGNYLSRRISEKFIVISTFDIETLELADGISIENYILRFTYAFTIIFNAYNGFKIEASEIMQNNITGCLFDKAIYKKQIATFFKNPHISISAKNILNSKTLNENLIPNTENDIKYLKISRYYVYSNWLKRNPILATIIIFISGLLLNELGGNFLYDWITGNLCK